MEPNTRADFNEVSALITERYNLYQQNARTAKAALADELKPLEKIRYWLAFNIKCFCMLWLSALVVSAFAVAHDVIKLEAALNVYMLGFYFFPIICLAGIGILLVRYKRDSLIDHWINENLN